MAERLKKTGQESACLIIGADTIVTKEDIIYGKPKSETEAFETLKKYCITLFFNVTYYKLFLNIFLVFQEKVILFIQESV